jgi:hypothetical protein
VTGGLRYLLVTTARTRSVLAPLAGFLFALLGVYAYRRNEVGLTWGLTALLSCGLAAWLVGAVLAAEPRPQAEAATAALGGWRRRARVEVELIAVVTAVFTVVFLAYPSLLHFFDRRVRLGDVVAAGLGHAGCAVLGGAIGVLYAPPRVSRAATSTAAALATLLGLLAVPALGPLKVAEALRHAQAGAVDGAEVAAAASCVLLAAAVLAVSRWWLRRAP